MQLSIEQKLILQTAQDFAQRTLIPNTQAWSEGGIFPKEAITALGELGFMGLLVPSVYGGCDSGYISYVLAIEAIAYGDASVSTILGVHNSVACLPILNYGSDFQKERYLKPMASGAMLGAFALSEPQAGSDATNLLTTAEMIEEGYYTLNGTKQFVTSGNQADVVIVLAITDKQADKKKLSAFIVPTNTPGFEVSRVEKKMGQNASHTAQITLNNVKIPLSHRLGKAGDGYRIALSTLESGRLGIAAQALGIAQRALDLSVEYAKDRWAFNKPIIKHQSIAFKLADMATNIEAGRALLYNGARHKEIGNEAVKFAAMTKLFCTEMAQQVCYEAIQIFGGYGYLRDYPLEQLYRDVRVTTIYEGTSDIQKIIISRSLNKQSSS